MPQNNSQVPWTDEQWARVNQVVQEEASRARVAATFLPLYGPLPSDTDFVRNQTIGSGPAGNPRLTIADTETIPLATLQVKVLLRGAQMADPDLTSALQLFRRAANILARLEDTVVFQGQLAADEGPRPKRPEEIWEILGGRQTGGLLDPLNPQTQLIPGRINGQALVSIVSESIGRLESDGHFGPFAMVLGQNLFLTAQTPNNNSLVLPQDRILPFLSGGPLLRSSTIPERDGVVVALGGAPVELVVATDVSINFLQVTSDPSFVFRVYEKIALRIKEQRAIMPLRSL